MAEFTTPPIKRHPALQPLSRDHYVGLVQAQHLIKAAAGSDVDRRAAVADFIDAWDGEISVHFDDEERLLVPLADDAHAQRLRDEHDRLRSVAEEARERRRQVDPGADWVREAGTLLNEHIRWEEREMFPAIEAAAPEALRDMEPETSRIEASRPRNRSKKP